MAMRLPRGESRIPTPTATLFHVATATSLPQNLHFVAAKGRPSERQLGHTLVGSGSPKTDVPRRFMYAR